MESAATGLAEVLEDGGAHFGGVDLGLAFGSGEEVASAEAGVDCCLDGGVDGVGGGGFSEIGTGSGGAPQGLQYINVFADYNNADQDPMGVGAYVEANVFQEMSPAAVDVGNTWRFTFD